MGRGPAAPGSVGIGARPAVPSSREAGPGERRLFVAVPVEPTVRERVGQAVAEARRICGDSRGLRWVGADALHLTLRFLGATPEGRVVPAADAVAEAARRVEPFALRLGASGAFPGAGAPRALWLGVDEGGPELAALARFLDSALAARGWPSDPRPFRAHLTVARAEDPGAGRQALAAMAEAARDLRPAWRADALVLFESHLGHGPARYAAVREAPLGR